MSVFRIVYSGDLPTTRHYQYLGGVLAFVVAAVHLTHPDRGLPRLLLLVRTDNLVLLSSDPRPLLFVLSGLAIVGVLALVPFGLPPKPIYVLGMALVATYLVGYFGWHLTGHGGFLPGRFPHYHGLSPIEAVLTHLQDNPIARVSKFAEALLLVILAILYRRAH